MHPRTTTGIYQVGMPQCTQRDMVTTWLDDWDNWVQIVICGTSSDLTNPLLIHIHISRHLVWHPVSRVLLAQLTCDNYCLVWNKKTNGRVLVSVRRPYRGLFAALSNAIQLKGPQQMDEKTTSLRHNLTRREYPCSHAFNPASVMKVWIRQDQ